MIIPIVRQYQTVSITTASPADILVALFDAAAKFLTLAQRSMETGKRARAGEAIGRAHAIISELYTSLDHKQYPELCANLSRLYAYCLRTLTQANLKNDPERIGDVLRVLQPVREAFQIAAKEVAKQEQEPKKEVVNG